MKLTVRLALGTLLVLSGVMMQSAWGACPTERLLDTRGAYLVSNPDWAGSGGTRTCFFGYGCYADDPDAGWQLPPISPNISGVFWGFAGFGDPGAGGIDNGTWDVSNWTKQVTADFGQPYYYPAFLTTDTGLNGVAGNQPNWGSDARIDGCITDAFTPAIDPEECTCVLLTDAWSICVGGTNDGGLCYDSADCPDGTCGVVGFFAALSSFTDAITDSFDLTPTTTDVAGVPTIRLSPIPQPLVVNEQLVGDPAELILEVEHGTLNPASLQTDGTCDCGIHYEVYTYRTSSVLPPMSRNTFCGTPGQFNCWDVAVAVDGNEQNPWPIFPTPASAQVRVECGDLFDVYVATRLVVDPASGGGFRAGNLSGNGLFEASGSEFFSCSSDLDRDGDGFAGNDDCDDNDPNNWTSCLTCDDADSDTWYVLCDAYTTINGPDCDDADADNFPTNPEVCDGQDNDCSGAADFLDELIDGDSDGVPDCADVCQGDDLTGDSDADGVCDDLDLCQGDDATGDVDGDGYCFDSDCDDADANNFLTNPEVCDGQDNDCSGTADFPDELTDSDSDGVLDCADVCQGDDLTGDSDADGVCDDLDLCQGDDATGDGDSDGYCFDSDCDDADANNFPTNPEVCDGQDNDCSGTADFPGELTDGDSDGVIDCADICQGDDLTGDSDADGVCDDLDLCQGDDATGDVDSDGYCFDSDCDDADANNFPTNPEVCDGQDNDCSGTADFPGELTDGDSDGVIDCADVCQGDDLTGDSDADGVCDDLDLCQGDDATGDVDGDGYCADSDCDDADANNFPTNPEVCDGQDNDCSGTADFPGELTDGDSDGVIDCADVCQGDDLTGDSDADGVCDDLDLCQGDDATGDVDGDGYCADSDCDDADANNFPTNPEVCDGQDNDCSGTADFPDELTDSDSDGVLDCADVCQGDDLTGDSDADGVCDDLDLCQGDDATGDGDSDGYCFDSDCDDADANNFPTNPEVCDGQDNDCSGTADFPGELTDGDSDGVIDCADICQGDDLTGDSDADGVCDDLDLCQGDDATGDGDGDGYCFDSDCDDADANNFPTNPEVCDGQDNDCSGTADFPGELTDGDSDGVIDCADVCQGDDLTGDSDADGVCDDLDLCQGDDATGDVDSDGYCFDSDCDDADANNFPTNPEVCDGQDNDCSGTADFPGELTDGDSDGVIDCADVCQGDDLTGDSDADGVCDDLDLCQGDDATGDVDGDGYCFDSDCDDADANNFPTNPEVCDGQDNDCSGTADFPDELTDSDSDGVLDCADVCQGDDLTGDSDADGVCDDLDLCQGDDATGDGDSDGYCFDSDCDDADANNFPTNPEVCDGQDNDCSGTADFPGELTDGDSDGVIDCADICQGDDLTGDNDADGVCDDLDLCQGDDATGDVDGDGYCADSDCDDADGNNFPTNPEVCDGQDNDCSGTADFPGELTDGDSDGVIDCADVCQGDDATGDSDADGVCDDLDLCQGDDATGDVDGDGYCFDSDCDDADANNFPTNPEVCDGQDNDCSGTADFPGELADSDSDGVIDCADVCQGDDLTGDSDGDGVCDDLDLCQGDDATGDVDGDGYCFDSDCDDADANNFPTNPEVCDGQDNDCSGAADFPGELTDSDSDGVLDCADVCQGDDLTGDSDADGVCDDLDLCQGDDATGDADSDGYCSDSDCDDADANNFPTNPEVCDGQDNDCSGAADFPGELTDSDSDGVIDCADVCQGDDLTGDSDGDGVCDDLDLCQGDDATGDVDGDGYCFDSDCDDADANNFPTNPEVCDGQDNDCSGTADFPGELADSDSDGVIDCADVCQGDDLTGDSDGDGVCDDLDLCQGDDATGDADSDGYCSDSDCNDSDPNNWTSCVTCVDGDSDTWYVLCDAYATIDGPDCDDADVNNYPTNPEICDGQDNDCSGTADFPGELTDGDSDGVLDCADVCVGDDATGDSDADGVCDDADVCQGDDATGNADGDAYCSDSDCNDNDPNNWTSCLTCVDADSDTWYILCDSYTTIDGPDCDDADINNFPTNAEICDGQDNDCSGTADLPGELTDGDSDGVIDCADICQGDDLTGDSDADGVCDDLDLCQGDDATGDVDGDGYCFDSDCDDADANNFPTSPEICDGQDNDCSGTADFPGELTDSDSDGVIDCADVCQGDDATGDSDADGVCDDLDLCQGDDATGDGDVDGYCFDSDCDDADANNFPTNPEVCDGQDNDCSGTADFPGELTDGDSDGVLDCADLCQGDDATGDSDADGMCGNIDNCPDDPNADQANADGDALGDVCDACPDDFNNDADDDGVCGDVDNCPTTPNPLQEDDDVDGLGDACDTCPSDPNNDADGDTICGEVDNCPGDPNTDQANADGDALGDVCDSCPNDPDDDVDGDNRCADVDNCPGISNPNQKDDDSDGLGNVCDPCPDDPTNDVDEDTVCGGNDNCPNDANTNQSDADGDAIGDVCDVCPDDFNNDEDGDVVCGDVDNCPTHPNTDQIDIDGDGLGDACDACPIDPDNDIDSDTVCGNIDNCPTTPNPGQEDTDADGYGDVCESCPGDPYKIDSGLCGCGISDTDTDGDFVVDCVDTDDDNDGVDDLSDCAPLVNSVSETPGELDDNLRIGPSKSELTWDNLAQANVFDVYRGTWNTTTGFAYSHACLGTEVPDTRHVDPVVPGPGELFYYVVGGRNSCAGGYGSLGFSTTLGERPNDTPCPMIGADLDFDGIPDIDDNCPLDSNADQNDVDQDGLGDVCDSCPVNQDPTDADLDGDGIGDACDSCTDTDGDGFGNPGFPASLCPPDNCPTVSNATQSDGDADGFGDRCDACPVDPDNDADFDGVCGNVDNCPAVSNRDQDDLDADGPGDACDDCTDSDGDGLGNPGYPANTCADDNCPLSFDPTQLDSDTDGIGDVCDNCPTDPNANQLDADADGFGDVCDPCVANPDSQCVACPDAANTDPDGDGVCDSGAVVVTEGSSMRYLANVFDPGVGMTWVNPVFFDTFWTDGVYGVGYDTDPSGWNLITTFVDADSRSIYTRVTFEVADPSEIEQILLACDWDDGYAAWINGDEVFRSVQMPATGPVAWDTLAAGHESSNGTSPNFSQPEVIQGATLVSGTNTLAIGVWNQTFGSTDLILVPQLTIKTSADNCPLVPNPDQVDTDGDGHGDACDL